MEEKAKKIEVVTLKAVDLQNSFENPRKVKRGKLKELRDSLETFGDFGVIVIDEKNNILSGTQRVSQQMEIDPNQDMLCKRLVGYTEVEMKAINIKANEHAGEWDLDILSRWTADLGMDIDAKVKGSVEERKIDEMELVRFEKYNYILVAFKTEMEYNLILEKLGLVDKKVTLSEKSKERTQARAIWFDRLAKILKK